MTYKRRALNRYLFILFLGLFLTLGSSSTSAQVNIILDTDFGGDVDDLGALCMLNNLMDKKECNLIAVVCWSTEKYAVAAIDGVNRYYQHPTIPIGARKGGPHYLAWNYSEALATKFKSDKSSTNVPEATALYRAVLAKAADASIVILTIGPLKNIENLILSQADKHSSLTGKELLAKKVKEVVIMGGQFPQSTTTEWNFDGNMPGVTQHTLKQLKVPIVFVGAEVGGPIKTGQELNTTDPNTPLYIGWLHFSRNAPWMKSLYTGKIINNPCFDQAAVLYAVRNGEGIYWDRIEGGYCEVDDKGNNKWITGSKSNHSYLKLKTIPEELAILISKLMRNN